jgi:hypothetical protein
MRLYRKTRHARKPSDFLPLADLGPVFRRRVRWNALHVGTHVQIALAGFAYFAGLLYDTSRIWQQTLRK